MITTNYNDSAIECWLDSFMGCMSWSYLLFLTPYFFYFMTKTMQRPEWMKPKGYLHLTPSLPVSTNWKVYCSQIKNRRFVLNYNFFPLIYSEIRDRRYKLSDPRRHTTSGRAHSHIKKIDGKVERMTKLRPLHYSAHFDSLVYAYTAHVIRKKYESVLKKCSELDMAVTAYRKIYLSDESKKGRSSLHFAKEVFDEIKMRVGKQKEVGVLAFDIKSFFSSLDHAFLREKWIEVVGENDFYSWHVNVYKSCTDFRYVLLEDLRILNRKGFNEQELAKIRREKGFKCFFESNQEFRKNIKNGRLRIYSNPFFRNDKTGKVRIGIPQGLPISTVLANIYLLDFDKQIIDRLVKGKGIFYRRYSDDLIFICKIKDIEDVEKDVYDLIRGSHLQVSKDKTEKFRFLFRRHPNSGVDRIVCDKMKNTAGMSIFDTHMTYLGFEFRGYNVTIKSANLAKYYRRIISVVKRRSRRAKLAHENNPSLPNAIYINQIKKLIERPIRVKDGDKFEIKQDRRKIYCFKKKENGWYRIHVSEANPRRHFSSYVGYVYKCVEVFGDKIFLRQIRKRRKITFEAIRRHLAK